MGNSGVGISLVAGPEMQEEDEFVVTSSESAQMDEAFAEPE